MILILTKTPTRPPPPLFVYGAVYEHRIQRPERVCGALAELEKAVPGVVEALLHQK